MENSLVAAATNQPGRGLGLKPVWQITAINSKINVNRLIYHTNKCTTASASPSCFSGRSALPQCCLFNLCISCGVVYWSPLRGCHCVCTCFSWLSGMSGEGSVTSYWEINAGFCDWDSLLFCDVQCFRTELQL